MTTAAVINGRRVLGWHAVPEKVKAEAGFSPTEAPVVYGKGDYAPLRSGQVVLDVEDGLARRLVEPHVLETPGWNDAEAWLKVLRLEWDRFRHLVEVGVFDAAVCGESGARVYRCVDSSRIKPELAKLATRRKPVRWR